VFTTDQKGAIAETAIIHEATKLGIGVFKPVNDGSRCDLIFAIGRGLVRVQCKWAPRRGEVIVLRCYSCRRSRKGLLKKRYTADEIDAFAAYCPDVDRCYFVPINELRGETGMQLRVAPTRNNQRRGINWADAYEFAATLSRTQGP
jgi:predicted RNA-binding Zn-ribbon protein involved in translation (DUF1610 family)